MISCIFNQYDDFINYSAVKIMQTKHNNKQNRTITEVPPNDSFKRRINREKSVGALKKAKKKDHMYNLENFLTNYKGDHIKTERYLSPKHNIIEILDKSRREKSSLSKQLNKSIQRICLIDEEVSREKSGEFLKKPKNIKVPSKEKNKINKKRNQIISILQIPPNISLRDFSIQIFNKLNQVQGLFVGKSKEETHESLAFVITQKCSQLFSNLIQIMINEISSLLDVKESENLVKIEQITQLKNDMLEKQSIIQRLHTEKMLINQELENVDKIITKQNKYIFQLKQKESRVSRLLYSLRKKGIDLDQIYCAELQTPLSRSSSSSSNKQSSYQYDNKFSLQSDILNNFRNNNSY